MLPKIDDNGVKHRTPYKLPQNGVLFFFHGARTAQNVTSRLRMGARFSFVVSLLFYEETVFYGSREVYQ